MNEYVQLTYSTVCTQRSADISDLLNYSLLCLYVHAGARGGQRRTFDPLELELQDRQL